MGRRKYCDKLGKEHNWIDEYPSNGGRSYYYDSKHELKETSTLLRQVVCNVCRKPKQELECIAHIWDSEKQEHRKLTEKEKEFNKHCEN